ILDHRALEFRRYGPALRGQEEAEDQASPPRRGPQDPPAEEWNGEEPDEWAHLSAQPGGRDQDQAPDSSGCPEREPGRDQTSEGRPHEVAAIDTDAVHPRPQVIGDANTEWSLRVDRVRHPEARHIGRQDPVMPSERRHDPE